MNSRIISKQSQLTLPRTQIAEFCQRHHIRKLSLFGSALRDDFGPDSDIDILIEFEPGQLEQALFILRTTLMTPPSSSAAPSSKCTAAR